MDSHYRVEMFSARRWLPVSAFIFFVLFSRSVQADPSGLRERAASCSGFDNCLNVMLDAADPFAGAAVQEAAERIAKLPRASPQNRKTADNLKARAFVQFQTNNVPAAIELMQRAALQNPEDAEIHATLALFMLHAGQVDEAERPLRTALKLNPRSPDLWMRFADIRAEKGDGDKAMRSLLLAYEFSSNKQATLILYYDLSTRGERPSMRPVYADAFKKRSANFMVTRSEASECLVQMFRLDRESGPQSYPIKAIQNKKLATCLVEHYLDEVFQRGEERLDIETFVKRFKPMLQAAGLCAMKAQLIEAMRAAPKGPGSPSANPANSK